MGGIISYKLRLTFETGLAHEFWLKFFDVYHFSSDEVMLFLCHMGLLYLYRGFFCQLLMLGTIQEISSSCQNKPVFVGGNILILGLLVFPFECYSFMLISV